MQLNSESVSSQTTLEGVFIAIKYRGFLSLCLFVTWVFLVKMQVFVQTKIFVTHY